MVAGIPTPRSDADILVQVATSGYANPRDRVADIMRALRPIAFPIDIFVYTTDELSDPAIAGSGMVTAALRDGIDLLSR